jgi:hypothetical protein
MRLLNPERRDLLANSEPRQQVATYRGWGICASISSVMRVGLPASPAVHPS